jgi:hypothetical protein
LILRRPPGAPAVGPGYKALENRTWQPDGQLTKGEWLALHSGKAWDKDAMTYALQRGVPIELFEEPLVRVEMAIVGVVKYGGWVTSSVDRWFSGPIAWKIEDAVEIEPVPCRGKQGLWHVHHDLREVVRDRFARRRQEQRLGPAPAADTVKRGRP